MKLSFFANMVNKIVSFKNHVYLTSDGILFDGGLIHLPFYLRGSNNVSFFELGLIRIYNLMNKQPKYLVYLEGLGNFSSVHMTDDEYPLVSDVRNSICEITKLPNDGDFISTYVNLETGKRVIPTEQGGICYCDDQCILVARSGFLYCSDWNDNLLWRKNFSSSHGYYRPNCIFQNIDNGILFNAGMLEDKTGAILLVNKLTGEMIWERKFPVRVEDSRFINGKIYLCVANKMMVMNVQGEIELEFLADVDDQELLTFWTDGQLLYVFATLSNQLIAYTSQGTLIRRYQFPEHPRLWHGSLITRAGDLNYLRLGRGDESLVGVDDGVVTWTAEDVLSGKELEIEQFPPFECDVVKEEDGTQSYSLKVPCTDLNELLRIVEIEVRRLIALRAKQYYYDNRATLNRKFNGKIVLIIDPAIGQDNTAYLDMLVKRCNFFAKTAQIKSGSGKKEVQVSWRFPS